MKIVKFILSIIIIIIFLIFVSDILYKRELNEKASFIKRNSNIINDKYKIEELPYQLIKYFEKCYVDYNFSPKYIELSQNGQISLNNDITKEPQKWFNFESFQIFNLNSIDFIWSAKINMHSVMWIRGFDYIKDNVSNMQWKMFSLAKVVDMKNSEELLQGAVTRYISEMPWFPTSFFNKKFVYEKVNDKKLKITFNLKNRDINGFFYFNDKGYFEKFETKRYRYENNKYVQTDYVTEYSDYRKTKSSIIIPHKGFAAWKIKDKLYKYVTVNIKNTKYQLN